MRAYRPMQLGDKFFTDRLGLVIVCDIESNHTIIVVDSKDRYYRMSGLSINLREGNHENL